MDKSNRDLITHKIQNEAPLEKARAKCLHVLYLKTVTVVTVYILLKQSCVSLRKLITQCMC